jgi:hypothetical protein
MCNDERVLKNLQQKNGLKANVADNCALSSNSPGEGKVTVSNGDVNVKDVMFVPELSTNLLSVSQMVNNNLILVFSEAGCSICHKDDVKIMGKASGTATHVNGLFKLAEFSCNKDVNSNDSVKTFAATSKVSNASANLWHNRLGHVCHERILQLEKLVDGYKCIGKPDNSYVGCCLGKQARMLYNHPGTRATELLELVPSDVCVYLQTESLGKSHYMLTFTGDYSRKTFVYF